MPSQPWRLHQGEQLWWLHNKQKSKTEQSNWFRQSNVKYPQYKNTGKQIKK